MIRTIKMIRKIKLKCNNSWEKKVVCYYPYYHLWA